MASGDTAVSPSKENGCMSFAAPAEASRVMTTQTDELSEDFNVSGAVATPSKVPVDAAEEAKVSTACIEWDEALVPLSFPLP